MGRYQGSPAKGDAVIAGLLWLALPFSVIWLFWPPSPLPRIGAKMMAWWHVAVHPRHAVWHARAGKHHAIQCLTCGQSFWPKP